MYECDIIEFCEFNEKLELVYMYIQYILLLLKQNWTHHRRLKITLFFSQNGRHPPVLCPKITFDHTSWVLYPHFRSISNLFLINCITNIRHRPLLMPENNF